MRLVGAGLGALQDSQLAKLLLMGVFLLSEMSHYLEVRFVSAPLPNPGLPLLFTSCFHGEGVDDIRWTDNACLMLFSSVSLSQPFPTLGLPLL